MRYKPRSMPWQNHEVMIAPLVLSHYQTTPLLKQRESIDRGIKFSPDLGLSFIDVRITPAGVELPHQEILMG